MNRTVTAVFSSKEVMTILAKHLIAARDIRVCEESQMEGELLAIAGRDESGEPGIIQYRLSLNLKEIREPWQG